MGLISALKTLFTQQRREAKAPEVQPSVTYGDYLITPASVQEEQGYRINGTITKGDQAHTFIRADTLPTADACAQEMVRKAKQMIDQQGDNLFN